MSEQHLSMQNDVTCVDLATYIALIHQAVVHCTNSIQNLEQLMDIFHPKSTKLLLKTKVHSYLRIGNHFWWFQLLWTEHSEICIECGHVPAICWTFFLLECVFAQGANATWNKRCTYVRHVCWAPYDGFACPIDVPCQQRRRIIPPTYYHTTDMRIAVLTSVALFARKCIKGHGRQRGEHTFRTAAVGQHPSATSERQIELK